MGFDAGTVVDPLDWTFVAITKDTADQGTIKEPTDKMIDDLFQGIRTLVRELGEQVGMAKGALTPEQAMEGLADLPDGSEKDFGIDTYLEEVNELFATACSGSPSAAQLAKLPMRIRMPFFAWLLKELRPNNFGGVSMTPDLRLVKPA
jgi:hypothetical protein